MFRPFQTSRIFAKFNFWKLSLTLSAPVVFLNSPNLSPYFSLNKSERIWLLIFSCWLCLINSHFLITKCHILYVLYKEKLVVGNWLALKGLMKIKDWIYLIYPDLSGCNRSGFRDPGSWWDKTQAGDRDKYWGTWYRLSVLQNHRFVRAWLKWLYAFFYYLRGTILIKLELLSSKFLVFVKQYE